MGLFWLNKQVWHECKGREVVFRIPFFSENGQEIFKVGIHLLHFQLEENCDSSYKYHQIEATKLLKLFSDKSYKWHSSPYFTGKILSDIPPKLFKNSHLRSKAALKQCNIFKEYNRGTVEPSAIAAT